MRKIYYPEYRPEVDRMRFNVKYLRRSLERLEKQKLIEIKKRGDKYEVKVTKKGKTRILKYSLEDLSIEKPEDWDGKWRVVSYDLPESLRAYRDTLRRFFKRLGFYQLHKSVYLHAYPCEKQVEFLREFYGLGKYITLFKVEKIENEELYRRFFDV